MRTYAARSTAPGRMIRKTPFSPSWRGRESLRSNIRRLLRPERAQIKSTVEKPDAINDPEPGQVTDGKGRASEKGLHFQAGERTDTSSVKPIPKTTRTNSNRIQRAVNFLPGSVHFQDFAERIAAGTTMAAKTPYSLNQRLISLADHAEADKTAKAAVNPPKIDGIYEYRGKKIKSTTVWIDSVPTNEGSFEMYLPSSGPWVTTTTKDAVNQQLGLESCVGGDPCLLTVHGEPDIDTLNREMQTHEERHAVDHERAFYAAFRAWDKRVTAAKNAKAPYTGPTAQAAETKLWMAVGGSPDKVATTYRKNACERGKAFHRAEPEPRLALFEPKVGPDCNTASVKAHNSPLAGEADKCE